MLNDKLLVNLKILSKIPKNGRVRKSSNGVVSLETSSWCYYPSVYRTLNGDGRSQTVDEINSIVSECIAVINSLFDSKFLYPSQADSLLHNESLEYTKRLELLDLLLQEINASRIGISNLKFTYKNDHNIESNIDVILMKIDTVYRESSNKLAFLKSLPMWGENRPTTPSVRTV